jgi:hypothetical protein
MGLVRKEVPGGPPAPAGSLAEAFATVPEPRRPYGWRPEYPPLPLVGLLQVTVVATLCGARSQAAIVQWARERLEDRPAALEVLGLPPGRRPSAATLSRVFRALDVAAFERALGTWLARTGVGPVDAVAVDGKTLRGIHGEDVPGVHLVAAYAHGAGAVLAQVAAPGKGQELAAAQALLADLPLAGRVVTGDALLTQRAICAQVVAAEGDYLLPIDQNQPTLRTEAEEAFSPLARRGAGRAPRRGRRPADPALVGRPRRADHRRDRPRPEGPPRAS